MPNFKVSYENKLKAVLEYLNENTTQTDIAKKIMFLLLHSKYGLGNINPREKMD